MTEEQLRAIVREVVARHLGTPAQGPASPGPVMAAGWLPEGPVWKGHASHVRLSLQTGGQADGPCMVEPTVPCTHCGFCQSFGH